MNPEMMKEILSGKKPSKAVKVVKVSKKAIKKAVKEEAEEKKEGSKC